MGWTVGRQTREELITELLGLRHHETVAHRLVAGRLWCVKRYLRDGKQRQYIALFLLQDFGRGEYGYKDLDETQHPAYYDCPLEFLAQVEPYAPLHGARAWRDGVRAFHAGGSALATRVRRAHARSVVHG